MTSEKKKLFARDSGPGVPEAITQILGKMSSQLKTENIETIWIFPPMIKKRKEWGLIAVSCFAEGTSRSLYTGRYFAQREGGKLSLDVEISEEGSAPVDSLARVMIGVVKRSQIDLGSPKAYMIEGKIEVFETLLKDLEDELMETAET
jgi:chemotaxis protein CheY-P-specific phosphatase CheC|tara:strand:+ start:4056 stop:4499 length:444 start_codon:yes stop_codon:yes gene_type:complete